MEDVGDFRSDFEVEEEGVFLAFLLLSMLLLLPPAALLLLLAGVELLEVFFELDEEGDVLVWDEGVFFSLRSGEVKDFFDADFGSSFAFFLPGEFGVPETNMN